jgi:hypothetical protein
MNDKIQNVEIVNEDVTHLVQIFQESLINLNENIPLLEESVTLQEESFNVMDFFNCEEDLY